MIKKCFVVILMIMSALFGQKSEEMDKNVVVPVIFSWKDSKIDQFNPHSEIETNFHITLLSGRVAAVRGIQLGIISNHVKRDFIGYDATGICSRIAGNYAGYQTVGILSKVAGNFTGIQETGIYSEVGGDFIGIQSAGIASITTGFLKGAQLSGIVNRAQTVKGGQFTGIINKATDVVGVQSAGIVNKAGNVTGAQISGIVNKADHVKGVQIGIVNRSKKLDGIAIGLVNLSDEGSVHAIGWAGGSCDFSGGLKFAPNDYWYTLLTFGDIQDHDQLKSRHVFESRMGLHYPLLSGLYIEGDLGTGIALSYNMDDWEEEENNYQTFDARLALGLKIGSRLSIFGGVSRSFIGSGDDDNWMDDAVAETNPFFGIQF